MAGGDQPQDGDGTIRIYDAESWDPIADIVQPVDDVACLAWHPRMPRLASGNQKGMIKIWDTSTGHEVFSMETSSNTVYYRIEQLDWSPDGQRCEAFFSRKNRGFRV